MQMEDLHSLTRKPSISFPRQIVMTLMREAKYTWEACGGHFGLDYGTAIHAAKVVSVRASTCTTFADQLHRLRRAIAAQNFQPLGTSQTSVLKDDLVKKSPNLGFRAQIQPAP